MMKNFTYTKKCYLLFAGFLLFIIMAWKFSVSETFRHRSEIGEKEGRIQLLQNKEKDIPNLEYKVRQMETICKDADSVSVRDKLTAYISDFAENNNCVVTEIPGADIFNTKGNSIHTNSFTIRGNFKALLRLEQLVEQRFRTDAMIMSVRYFTLKNSQKKKKELYLTLITQSVSKTNENI